MPQAIHLRRALLGAGVEGVDDEVAVGCDVLEVLLLVSQIGLVLRLLLLLRSLVRLAVRDRRFQVGLLGLEIEQQLLGNLEILLEELQGSRLGLHSVRDLGPKVLDDGGQDRDDALGLALPLALVREDCIGRVVRRALELRALLQEVLQWAELDFVFREVRGQELRRLREQADRILVGLLRLEERLVLGRPLGLHVRDLLAGGVDLLDRLLLLLLQLLDQRL
mmetsp:Transcript_71959/g.187184  ORF Transcript_71959/g.187184 Transcript_71959/m.187184 type:complete len:222 (-) Transcript_71959:1480-2145(-)